MASGEGGGTLIKGRQNPTQIMAPLPVIKIVKYCDVWGGGGIGGGGASKSYKRLWCPLFLSLR